MQPKHIHNVRALCKVLKKKGKMNLEELTHLLYAIPKRVGATPEENKAEQLAFFRNVYRMLFGKDTGPRLPQFLLDVNRKHALTLLNI
jgi:lysyl-tRNA synthetase class 1